MSDKMNTPGYRIRELWVFVSIDADGDEGMCAFMSETGWMPMIAADMKRVDSLRPIAQAICNESGSTVEVRHLTQIETVETISPRKEKVN